MAVIRHSCVLGDYFCNASHQPFKRLQSVWERNGCREAAYEKKEKCSLLLFFLL